MALPMIITGLFTLGKNWFSGIMKRKELKQEHKIKMAEMTLELKEKALAKRIASDTDIAKISTESMATSYRDEFLLIIFSVPVILCFIPGMDVHVIAGFTALSNTPIWFQTIYVVMCLTIYGHRKLARLFAGKFLGNGTKE